jgi:hypothetical protein
MGLSYGSFRGEGRMGMFMRKEFKIVLWGEEKNSRESVI